MAKFTANVFVHGENGPVFFEEGDEVPDWAASLVGAHVLDTDASEAESESAKDDDEEPEQDHDDEDEPEQEPAAAKSDAPDFTAAAPRRGRARKA